MTEKDYLDIAKRHAEKSHHDVVKPAGERNGYHYFYIDYSVRPRYLGLPYIIKISPTGKVFDVLNTATIFWAYNQAIAGVQS